MQVPVGVLLDRFGSRAMLIWGLALMTVGQLGFAFAESFAGSGRGAGRARAPATRWSSSA